MGSILFIIPLEPEELLKENKCFSGPLYAATLQICSKLFFPKPDVFVSVSTSM